MLHVLEHFWKIGERDFRVHEIAGADFAAGYRFERLPYESRRVMEGGLDRDLRIVERVRVHSNLGASRTASEQVDGTAAAHHLQRPFPRLRGSNGFDHRVRAASAFS